MLYDSLPNPTKENDWLGFCPGAVKLQNGDKKGALKKRTDYHDSFSASGVTTYICAEKKCAFQGHVSVDFVWKMVMKDETLGLQCRWAFLGKSPVAIITPKVRRLQLTTRQPRVMCRKVSCMASGTVSNALYASLLTATPKAGSGQASPSSWIILPLIVAKKFRRMSCTS